MIPVKVFHPRNRLAEIVRMPGGKTVAEALRDADSNLESMRDVCLARIDELVADLRAACPAGASPARDAQTRMSDYANEVITAAITSELHDLSLAARSLCALIERLMRAETWNQNAIDVHIAALMLLRSSATDAAGRAAVLEGLKKVVAKT